LCPLLCATGLCNLVAATLGVDDFLIACHAVNNTTNYKFNPLPHYATVSQVVKKVEK
jgi:hypothetical protein